MATDRGIFSKAAVLRQRGGPVELAQIWLPAPAQSQVLLKMRASGVCHSQKRHIQSPPDALPFLLGHEGVGEVVAVGGEVSHLAVGDLAAITWTPREPVMGRWQAPPCGATLDGAPLSGYVFSWSEYCLVWQGYAVKLPADCPLEFGAVLGCAINTGAGAVLNTAKVRADQSVLVFGAGGVGSAIIAMARAVGANPIIAVDVADDKLALARQFGATQILNVNRESIADTIQKAHGGVDFAFDNVGSSQTIAEALESLKSGGAGADNEGGTVVLIGIADDETLNIPADKLLLHQRKIVGSLGASSPERDFAHYLKLQKAGKLPLENLATQKYALEQVNDACAESTSGRAILVF